MIAGWTEALQLMVAGDQWELYIPVSYSYIDMYTILRRYNIDMTTSGSFCIPVSRLPQVSMHSCF